MAEVSCVHPTSQNSFRPDRPRIRLVIPAALDPVVWSTETSTTAEAVALRTPSTCTEQGDDVVFGWATDEPPMGARYRLEWRFRARDDDQPSVALHTASNRMRAAGITQHGTPILTATVRQ